MVADSSLTSFFDAVGKFFSSLADIGWGALALGVAFHVLNLTFRSRATFNVLRAAYPAERFQWRRIWGAYVAGVGFNAVVPGARRRHHQDLPDQELDPELELAGDRRRRSPSMRIFDSSVGIIVLIFAFTQGVFPKPPDFSKLNAFDLSFFANHPRFALFFITALAVLALVAFALLSARVKAFWARVRQGFTILRDRRRYFREVYAVQGLGWICRFIGFWFLLEAFHIGGSVRNVLLVFGVNAVSTIVPFTPGGAGVQQALLVKVFSGTASGATVAAYSVGQQVATASRRSRSGWPRCFFIFKFRSFKEVIRAGRAEEEREKARQAGAPSPDPAAPRARG